MKIKLLIKFTNVSNYTNSLNCNITISKKFPTLIRYFREERYAGCVLEPYSCKIFTTKRNLNHIIVLN